MKTGFLIDSAYYEHETPPEHPERAERLNAIVECLDRQKLRDSLSPIAARDAGIEEIALAHDKKYIEYVIKLGTRGGYIDPDTYVSSATFKAASRAVGGVINAVEKVLNDNLDSCFCAVRPPGHHARPEIGMGFCIFNNVAIAVRHLEKLGLDRIAIVDWDAHHGNGTQEIFLEDDRVLYISFHQYPHYPGTGSLDETGVGNGRGFNINIPLPPGSRWDLFAGGFSRVIRPVLFEFKPQLILVSAGFDAHKDDPLSQLLLESMDFADMTAILMGIVENVGSAGVVLILEGGYNTNALGESVSGVIETLLRGVSIDPLETRSWQPDESALFEDLLERISPFWSLI